MANHLKRSIGLSAVMLAAAAGVAHAQATAQLPLQFDFLNPGARSLSMGSAFVGLADDATSAFTNPAGLPILGKPEVSFELRYRRLETPYLERGRLAGSVTQRGEDTIAGPVYADSVDSGTVPSFISFVYPIDRFAIAAYRHDSVSLENDFLARGTFERSAFGGDETRDIPLSGVRRVDIANYGVSVGYRVNDHVSAGVGVSIYDFRMESSFVRLGFVDSLFGPVDFAQTGSTAVEDGDDMAAAVNAGVLLTVNDRFRVGAVYRQGPTFDYTRVDRIPGRNPLERDGEFHVPDVFGLGARVRLGEPVVVSVDYARVSYSNLKADFVDFQAVSSDREDQLSIDDGNEVHVGVEYTFLGLPRTPSLRAGFWFDPAHSVAYSPTAANDELDVRFSAALPGGEDLWHYSFGGGVPISPQLELNAGADFSKRGAYVSVSAVVRFGL